MKSHTLSALLVLGASVVRAAPACDAISADLTILGGESATVSAGTTATVEASGTAVVLDCGQASVTGSAVATLSGGTATMSGAGFNVYATGYIANSGVIADASVATLTVGPSATATVQKATMMFGTISDGASVELQGGSQNFFSGGAYTLTATNAGVYAYASGSGAQVYISNTPGGGGGNAVAAGTGAYATAIGDSVGAGALSGGVAYMSGTAGICSMGIGGTCTVAGTSQWLYCYASGSADILGGSSNSAQFGTACSGTISGTGNSVTVNNLASATLTAQATAVVASGGAVFVAGNVDRVSVSDFGTATLASGATVTAAPNAALFAASPQVSVSSVSDANDGYVVYVARNAGSNVVRRALPLPTGRCPTGKVTCPDLMGHFRCVDIESDIFNCGGCYLGTGVMSSGVDCTTLFDSEVACVRGQCVEQ